MLAELIYHFANLVPSPVVNHPGADGDLTMLGWAGWHGFEFNPMELSRPLNKIFSMSQLYRQCCRIKVGNVKSINIKQA